MSAREVIRSFNISDIKKAKLWSCPDGEHTDCWTIHHKSTEEVETEASDCAPSCRCWRHSVVKYTNAYKRGHR